MVLEKLRNVAAAYGELLEATLADHRRLIIRSTNEDQVEGSATAVESGSADGSDVENQELQRAKLAQATLEYSAAMHAASGDSTYRLFL